MTRRRIVALAVVSVLGALLVWRLVGEEPSPPPTGVISSRDAAPPASGKAALRFPAAPRTARRPIHEATDDAPGKLPIEAPGGATPETPGVAGDASRSPARAEPYEPVLFGHLADPCKTAEASAVPPGFAHGSADGVSVHWLDANDGSLIEADVLAHLTVGLLERAASLTETPRRGQLDVIVYPSEDAFHRLGKAPESAVGFYDGSVKLVEQRRGDVGVAISTLRHEVMHAQLHVGVGCAPIWFHEGAADYFAGRTKRSTWIRMLRRGQIVPFEQLAVSVLEDDKADEELVYAQSLAMVMLILAEENATTLRPLTEVLEAQPPDERLDLWEQTFPALSTGEFLDWMAHWIFGVDSRTQVPSEGTPLCCQGLRPADFRCYVAPPPERARRRRWIDRTKSPAGTCYASEY